jgi:tRNA G18 (ribose-2'-O)-methylase SpoU
MLGSEAKGLRKDLIEISDKNIRLEMSNKVESLNLSVSASIIFYELFIN